MIRIKISSVIRYSPTLTNINCILTTTVLTLPHTNKRLEVIYALSIIWLGHEIYTWGSYNIAKVMH